MTTSRSPTSRAADAAQPTRPAPKFARWHPWLAALVGAICFANSYSNGFVYDDVMIVQKNESIRSLANLRGIWLSDWWRPAVEIEPQQINLRRDRLYRPLTSFSLALQYQISGQAPMGYHIGNILMHALACALVWRFALLLWNDATISLVAGLIFAVHPLHCEAVANVVGRAEVIATLFLLFGLNTLLRSSAPSVGRTIAAAALFAGALLAKETAISYPAVALIALHARRMRTDDGAVAPVKWGRWALWAAVLLVPVFVYLPLRYIAMEHHLIRDDDPAAAINPVIISYGLQRIVLPFVILGHYVRLLLVPSKLSADYGMNIINPDGFDPIALLGFAGLLGLLFALWGYRRARGPWRKLGVAAALFAVSYVLISNTVLIIGVSAAERLMYWPSVPLILLISIVVVEFWRHQCADGRPLASIAPFVRVAGVGLLLALGMRSVVRNIDWQSNIALFQEDAFNWPQGSIMNRCYALELVTWANRTSNPEDRARYLERATQACRRALEISPRDPETLLTMANVYHELGDNEKAQKYAEAVLEARPNDLHARRLTRFILKVNTDEQIQELRAAADAHPENPQLRIDLGYRLMEAGKLRDALAEARIVVDSAPKNVEALKLIGKLEALAGNGSESRSAFEAAIAIDPNDWQSLINLTLLNSGDPPLALKYAERAYAIVPQSYEANLNLAEAYATIQRLGDAIARFRMIEQQLQADDPRLPQVRQRIRELSALQK